MTVSEYASRLLDYIKSNPKFNLVTEMDGNYDHMGATIVDGVLQSGLKYETVVKPRVLRILSNYPEAKTTSGFLLLLDKVPADLLLQSLDGKRFGGPKPSYIVAVANFLKDERIETEKEFRLWLESGENVKRLKKLKGIGDKTADYFKILVGIETNAIDRHLVNFLLEAGIKATEYRDCQEIINAAAEILGVNKALFDHSIWTYMSEKRK